jgi:hypothetical protein
LTGYLTGTNAVGLAWHGFQKIPGRVQCGHHIEMAFQELLAFFNLMGDISDNLNRVIAGVACPWLDWFRIKSGVLT